MSAPVYTIGYGGRSIETVLDLLMGYSIEYLIDVRSKPHSLHSPEFSHDALKERVELNGIRYLFMGEQLGGRPNDPGCYSAGRVNYAQLSETPYFKEGIGRLQKAADLNLTVALLCSESKPHECHRSKLIGKTLRSLSIEVRHIDEKGDIKTQEQVMERIGANQLSLFDDLQDWEMSRKTYAKTSASSENGEE